MSSTRTLLFSLRLKMRFLIPIDGHIVITPVNELDSSILDFRLIVDQVDTIIVSGIVLRVLTVERIFLSSWCRIQVTVQVILHPSTNPSASPSDNPSNVPSDSPSMDPSASPSDNPSDVPSDSPSTNPSASYVIGSAGGGKLVTRLLMSVCSHCLIQDDKPLTHCKSITTTFETDPHYKTHQGINFSHHGRGRSM